MKLISVTFIINLNLVGSRMGKKKSKRGFFRKFDIFGSSVTLTHAGEKKYKTILGSLLTVVFFCGIFAVSLEGVIKVYQGQIKSMATETRQAGTERFPEGVDIVERGFNFAFGFLEPLPPTIGYFHVKHKSQTWDEDG